MPQFVYMTTSNKEEALDIGRTLVSERLAACVNVLDNMTSLYWWNGQLEQGNEAVLIAKTSEERIDRLIARVKELHSYDCPCVVSWSIENGNEAYLNWIAGETSTRD